MNKVDALISRVSRATGVSSASELADALGINRSGVTHARNKNRIPDNWIVKLYRTFNLNPLWIETGAGPTFMTETGAGSDEGRFKAVPKVAARLSAGTGSFEAGESVRDYLCFQAGWLSRKGNAGSMVAMDVFGQSMEPLIREGDTVLIDQSRKDIWAGAVYAVGVEDTILIKRLEKRPDQLVLCSDNKDYDPIYLDKGQMETVRIIGKVIWSCREYR